jgi:hypothetical protein
MAALWPLLAGAEQQPCRAQQADASLQASSSGRPPRPSFSTPKRFRSSWDAKEAGGGRSTQSDYLSELGAAQQCEKNSEIGWCDTPRVV